VSYYFLSTTSSCGEEVMSSSCGEETTLPSSSYVVGSYRATTMSFSYSIVGSCGAVAVFFSCVASMTLAETSNMVHICFEHE
jgi:hypothetical protein